MKRILFATAWICGVFWLTATGATYTVNQSDDAGDGTCDTTCTLRDAVTAANTTEPLDDVIIFASFLTRITLSNEIAIDQSGRLLILGPGADRLTIDGGPGPNRIFYTFTSEMFTSELHINDLTLTGGNGGGSGIIGVGGAIYANTGNLLLDRVHITGNTATVGGGIYYNGTDLRILNSTLSNNAATGDCGGFNNRGDGLLVINSTISGNTAGCRRGRVLQPQFGKPFERYGLRQYRVKRRRVDPKSGDPKCSKFHHSGQH